MNGIIMNVVSCLHAKSITLLQAGLLLREVTSAKLDIGFRHATITSAQLLTWDKTIASAIATRSDLSWANLHHSAIFTILGIPTFTHLYATTKTIQIMDSITKTSELRHHYRAMIHPLLTPLPENLQEPHSNPGLPPPNSTPPSHDPDLEAAMTTLRSANITISPNTAGLPGHAATPIFLCHRPLHIPLPRGPPPSPGHNEAVGHLPAPFYPRGHHLHIRIY